MQYLILYLHSKFLSYSVVQVIVNDTMSFLVTYQLYLGLVHSVPVSHAILSLVFKFRTLVVNPNV
jgi:hypothetical protein